MGNLNEIIGLIDRHDVDGLFLTVVPVFTNLTIQATRPPPIRQQTPKQPSGAGPQFPGSPHPDDGEGQLKSDFNSWRE